MTKQEKFIRIIAPVIQSYALMKGYKYPSAIIAQACLESGFGSSALATKYFNYFGMKCGSTWRGKSVNLATKEEYSPGCLTSIRDNFRVYSGIEAGISGYFDFISTTRYSNLRFAGSPLSYLQIIKDAGYATDKSYVNKCFDIIEKYNLTQYDVRVLKDNLQIAKEVIAGKWGNGKNRKDKLTKAGYNYEAIQKLVNELLRG